MPQLGGMQVVKLMREIAQAPPAILLASDLSSALLREALGMHVFSVLSKPVDFNQLLDVLARVLRRFYESRWPQRGPSIRNEKRELSENLEEFGGFDGNFRFEIPEVILCDPPR